jgi:DNA-binding NarL/FixJ family response regulator
MYRGDEDTYRALQAGAVTYLSKSTLSQELVRVIREVHQGQQPAGHDLEMRFAQLQGHPFLTPREIQVTELIAQGMRNKEIGASLGISEETARVHVKKIFAKLKVHDRAAAVSIALRRGIIPFD